MENVIKWKYGCFSISVSQQLDHIAHVGKNIFPSSLPPSHRQEFTSGRGKHLGAADVETMASRPPRLRQVRTGCSPSPEESKQNIIPREESLQGETSGLEKNPKTLLWSRTSRWKKASDVAMWTLSREDAADRRSACCELWRGATGRTNIKGVSHVGIKVKMIFLWLNTQLVVSSAWDRTIVKTIKHSLVNSGSFQVKTAFIQIMCLDCHRVVTL